MTDLAAIAAAEFRYRQAQARQICNSGRWTPDQAEAALAPWLVIAARCRADLRELREQHLPLVSEAAWRAALAKACHAALEREGGGTIADHGEPTRRLAALCVGLAVMPRPAAPERIAA